MIEKRLLGDNEVVVEWGQYLGQFWIVVYDHHWPVGRGPTLAEAIHDLEDRLRVPRT